MTQASTISYPTPLPNAKDKDYPTHGYPTGYHPAFAPRPFVPGFTGVGDCWLSSAQGVMPGYPLCEGTPSPDILGFNNDPLVSCDPAMPNILSGIFPVTPDEELQLNYGVPGIESSSTDEGKYTKIQDAKAPVPPPFPSQSQSRPQYPPMPIPADKQIIEDMFPARVRRHSAPEFNSHDLERQLKHASRRASHNIVEKRYRINLNSKFRKLEEVVLKGTEPDSASPSSSRNNSSTTSSTTPLSARRQQSPKASIIDSALSYIESLQSENNVLKSKLDLYETSKPVFQGQDHHRHNRRENISPQE